MNKLFLLLLLTNVFAADYNKEDVQKLETAQTGKPMRMVRLLKFADKDLYQDFLDEEKPFLAERGANIIYQGVGNEIMLGVAGKDDWEGVLFIDFPTVEAALAHLKDERLAALFGKRNQSVREGLELATNVETMPEYVEYNPEHKDYKVLKDIIDLEVEKDLGEPNFNMTGTCRLIGNALLHPVEPVFLLNLLKYKKDVFVKDENGQDVIAKDSEGQTIDGKRLYEEYYGQFASYSLNDSFGTIPLYHSSGNQVVLGDNVNERQDGVLLVRYKNRFLILGAGINKNYKINLVPLRRAAIVVPDESVLLSTRQVDSFKTDSLWLKFLSSFRL